MVQIPLCTGLPPSDYSRHCEGRRGGELTLYYYTFESCFPPSLPTFLPSSPPSLHPSPLSLNPSPPSIPHLPPSLTSLPPSLHLSPPSLTSLPHRTDAGRVWIPSQRNIYAGVFHECPPWTPLPLRHCRNSLGWWVGCYCGRVGHLFTVFLCSS